MATSIVAYFVIGTVSPAAITLTPLLARFAGLAMPAGLAVGTITVSRLPAKFSGGPAARPLVTSFAGFVVSADRNTSAGAPCSIWVSRVVDESVEIVIVRPGLAVRNAAWAAVSAALSDDAP